MTRDELDETLDRMQASSRARGDTESSPGLITVESSHWVGHIAEVRARCASLQDGLRYRDIKIHVSSGLETAVLSRAEAGDRGEPYRDLTPMAVAAE